MKMFLHRMRGTPVCLALSLACASPAAAATTSLGQTAPAGTAAACSAGCTSFQQATGSGSPLYAVPAGGGTLTSWSIQGAPSALDCAVVECVARLRVLRPDGSGGYMVSAESPAETIGAGTLNTFPVSIPVQAGDLLGLGGTQIPFSFSGGTGDVIGTVTSVPSVGSLVGGPGGLPLTLVPDVQLNVSAMLGTGSGAGSGDGGSGAGSGSAGQGRAQFAGVRLSRRTLRVGRSGRVRIPVSCPAAASGSCRGTFTLLTIHPVPPTHRRLKLAAGRFVVPAGRTRSALVRVSSRGRSALARHGRLSARLTATARDGTGAMKSTSLTLLVRRR